MKNQKVKCLVAVINPEKSKFVVEICQRYGMQFTCGIPALGTARSELLDYLGIGETDKELLFSFLPSCLEDRVLEEIAARIHIRKPGHGIIFTISLSSMSVLFRQKVMQSRKQEGSMGHIEQIERQYELVLAVVERGFHDQVMDAAREAGATGGTVLHARSLHDEDVTSFLGIQLQGEKDVVAILTGAEEHTKVMQAVNVSCGLKTEARGLIFSLPVDRFLGI